MKAKFANFLPIFKNTSVSKNDIGDLTNDPHYFLSALLSFIQYNAEPYPI